MLVDFDGVLNNFHEQVCARIRRKYDIEYYPENITEWNTELPHGGSLIDEIEPLTGCVNTLEQSKPVTGARDGMGAFADAGYTLTIATHRPPSIHDSIQDWLTNHEIPYHNFVDDVPQNKGNLDADLLIDDGPPNVQDALQEGMHALHFTAIWDGSAELDKMLDRNYVIARSENAGDQSRGPVLWRDDSWEEIRQHIS